MVLKLNWQYSPRMESLGAVDWHEAFIGEEGEPGRLMLIASKEEGGYGWGLYLDDGGDEMLMQEGYSTLLNAQYAAEQKVESWLKRMLGAMQ